MNTREKVKELLMKYTYPKLDGMTAWEVAGKITDEITKKEKIENETAAKR